MDVSDEVDREGGDVMHPGFARVDFCEEWGGVRREEDGDQMVWEEILKLGLEDV